MKDSRVTKERRSFKPTPQFPFRDGDGDIVYRDRRTRADRRLNSIQLEEILVVEHIAAAIKTQR